MTWEPELVELKQRLELAAELGGPEAIARQHDHGKLTVRERIDLLADPGSFREFGALVGSATYDGDGVLTSFVPKPWVAGTCSLGGRKVVVSGSDFTVRGGSSGGPTSALGQELTAPQRSLEWRLPHVRLLDAAGGSVTAIEEIGRTYLPDGNSLIGPDIALLDAVPVVSAVLGSVAGGPAVVTPLSHFSVMVEGTSHVFAGGPPVVETAFGRKVTKEELGGASVHAGSGVVDNVAASEADALDQVRRFLSYLPASVDELPPRALTGDPAERREDELLSIIPRNRKVPYDMRELIGYVVDRGSFFEMGAGHGGSRITGLARIDGYPVGLIANDPMTLGGSTDVAAGEKSVRLIQLCDTFHLPVVTLADEPGFTVGPESERMGIERAGARLVWTVCHSRVPWITVVVRRLFGVAGQTHHRPSGMFRRYAWPSASWGSMPIQGGVTAAYRRVIESAEDPEATRRALEQRLEDLASPFRTAEATGQDIIDPRDTRQLLAEFVAESQRVLATQLGPAPMGYRP